MEKKGCGGKEECPADDGGAVLALVLIIGAAVALMGLALMQYALVEARTVQEFATAQNLFYVAEAGIETGVAVLRHNPHRREPVGKAFNSAHPEQGSFHVTFLRHDSTYEHRLPLGYESLSQLSADQVLICSRGVIKENRQERTLDLWVLAEREPLYTKALISRRLLHLKGLSTETEGGPYMAGIYGDVHIHGRLHLEAAARAERIFFRKLPAAGAAGPYLSYSSGVPISRRVTWDTRYGEPCVYVEADERTGGGLFVPGESPGGEGGYYRVYLPPASYKKHIPESAGFGSVPHLNFDFNDFKCSFLKKVQSSAGGAEGGPIIERPGGEVWNNDNIHLHNGRVTRVHGDLTLENTIDSDGYPVNPLSFDGVVIVEGVLTLRHYRRAGIGEGSRQSVRGVIVAREIRCLFDEDIPPDTGDTVLEITGLCVAEDTFSLKSAGKGAGGAADYRKVHGTVAAGEIFLQGPHTIVCQGEICDLIPEYAPYLPPDRYVIRQWFKPYLLAEK